MNKTTNYPLIAFTIILTTLIMHWGYYLIEHDYILRESFTVSSPTSTSSATSHTVDMPINNPLTCHNFCNPKSICAITGGQCTSDVDCPGCAGIEITAKHRETASVPGNDDAGKMLSVVQTDSQLTTDIGSRALKYPGTHNSPSPRHIQGEDTWGSQFDAGMAMYDKRYNPGASPLIMRYPVTYSLTGEFVDNGPPAANSTFSTF